MNPIFFTIPEYNYLADLPVKASHLKSIVDNVIPLKDKYLAQLSEDDIEELRDFCLDQMQIVGFDEKYNLSKDGVVLESLIDKLYR